MNDIRKHPPEHMTGVGELRAVTDAAAVVLRKDGSVDAYGPVAVIDQRPAPTSDMKFTVTYVKHQQYTGHASKADVMLALEALIELNVPDEAAQRARIAMVQLGQGFTPADLGIIAYALAADGFDDSEAEPGQAGLATDYHAELRES